MIKLIASMLLCATCAISTARAYDERALEKAKVLDYKYRLVETGMLDPENITYEDRNLKYSDFTKADLNGLMLMGADLLDSTFEWADLSGANLSSANLKGVDFTLAFMHGTTFSDAFLETTNFFPALDNGLHEADMRNCIGLTEDQKNFLAQNGAFFN